MMRNPVRGRLRSACLVALLCAPFWSCASDSSVGMSAARASGAAAGQPQSAAEVDRIMVGLKPTERFVANADSRLLWQAAQGYMQRAFPLDELPSAAVTGNDKQVRSKLVEWMGDGLPHRTRVFVDVRPDVANAANMRLRVTALMIESEPELEQAREGQPLAYNWRLVGSNSRVEDTIADQIMRRYLALSEGKPLPLDEELILPGLEQKSG
jgi:hypothetical protein